MNLFHPSVVIAKKIHCTFLLHFTALRHVPPYQWWAATIKVHFMFIAIEILI